MSATPTHELLLPAEITRRDIDRAVEEGRRRQAEEFAKLFHAACHNIARLARALVNLPATPRPTPDGTATA